MLVVLTEPFVLLVCLDNQIQVGKFSLWSLIPAIAQIGSRLSDVKRKILVMSGEQATQTVCW